VLKPFVKTLILVLVEYTALLSRKTPGGRVLFRGLDKKKLDILR
jgi:hypothetical protein